MMADRKKRKQLIAELREGLDNDIELKLQEKGLTGQQKAELIRNGLRVMLGIGTYRSREVRERHVPMPSEFLRTKRE